MCGVGGWGGGRFRGGVGLGGGGGGGENGAPIYMPDDTMLMPTDGGARQPACAVSRTVGAVGAATNAATHAIYHPIPCEHRTEEACAQSMF